VHAPTLKERALALIRQKPGITDRELTDKLLGPDAHPSPVNTACRQLAGDGKIRRQARPDGLTGNYPVEGIAPPPPPQPLAPTSAGPADAAGMSEDEVKRHVKDWLEAQSWQVTVNWGHVRGIDIEARRGAERWIIEAKGEGSLQPMRVNYFISMLGETLQRMDDATARYSIALPDHPQFRGLWQRLPALAKRRTQIGILFVKADGSVEEDRPI
jgi:hypothetical protein